MKRSIKYKAIPLVLLGCMTLVMPLTSQADDTRWSITIGSWPSVEYVHGYARHHRQPIYYRDHHRHHRRDRHSYRHYRHDRYGQRRFYTDRYAYGGRFSGRHCR